MEAPEEPRYTIAERDGSLVVHMPAQRRGRYVVPLGVVWGIALVIVILAWPDGEIDHKGPVTGFLDDLLDFLPDSWRMPVLLSLFGLLSVLLLVAIVVIWFAREELEISRKELVLRAYAGRWRYQEQRYDMATLRALRLSTEQDVKAARLLSKLGWDDSGELAFDYGSETVVFGDWLTRAEARTVLGRIADHLGLGPAAAPAAGQPSTSS